MKTQQWIFLIVIAIAAIIIFVMGSLFASSYQPQQKADGQTEKTDRSDWKQSFSQTLPLLGHRNWILVVDKAFPLQSAAGMKYINTQSELTDVVTYVLSQIKQAPHVRPVIYTDKELDYMNNQLSPSAELFRSKMKEALQPYHTQTLYHEAIFAKLDEASKLFNVIVLKTEGLIPYTSVFIELDCGYWSADKEKELRKLMNPSTDK